MRRTILTLSAACLAAMSGAGLAEAGDRYGPPEPLKPANVSIMQWNGPLLGWSNKAAPETTPPAEPAATATVAAPRPLATTAAPARAPALSAPLPTSIYAPPPPAPADAPAPALSVYQPARPTGEVITLSLADLPPPGPSLERQQAAEEDEAAMAGRIARAQALAAKDIAAGRPVTGGDTSLLGGP